MKKLSLSLFILLFGICCSFANTIIPGNQKIEKFVSEQGFFQNTISAIASDNIGYLWVGTPNGLIRYDGYSFEYFYQSFTSSESIPGNRINNLLNDSEGKLWIGTDKGVCIYHTDKEHFVNLKNVVSNLAFLKEGNSGKIWMGKGSTLHIYDPKLPLAQMQEQAVEINLNKDLEDEGIVDVEFFKGTEILLTTSKGIYKITFNDDQYSEYTVQRLLFNHGNSGITKLIKKDNVVWIGTDNGLYQTILENNRLTTIRQFFNSSISEPGNSIGILAMFSDKDENLWVGTKRDGVLKYNNELEGFISYKYDPKNDFGLTSNRINCFYEDEFGVVWIGTAQGGLNKLDKNQKTFHNYTHNPYDNNSLSSNLITNIFEDKIGRIWISFFDNVICKINKKIDLAEGHPISFERLEMKMEELIGETIIRILQDDRGYWWIATLDGLYFYDENNQKLKPIDLKSEDEIFSVLGGRVIEQIGPNQILIGGRQVYVLEDPWQWILSDKAIPVDRTLFDIADENAVNTFKKDVFGNLWFGTQDGIYRIQKKGNSFFFKGHLTTQSKNEKLRLSHNRIFCIHESSNRDIWVGAFGGGLMRIQLNPAGEPEILKTYHKADGLPDEVVYGILEDAEGKLWMSTDMGICCLDPLTEKFEVFDVNDGILNNNFRQSAFLKTNNGLMLMGGLNGLTIFDPQQIIKNEILPTVLISRLKINNHHIIAGKKFKNKVILEKSITETRELVLNHQNRNISLDILVQHNAAPKKNRLSYMLEGVNENWIQFDGGKATATYTNLSAGSYRFLYKGTNGDGIETPETGELIIHVLAPWYLRWWSLSLWGMLILFLAFGVFRYLVRLEKLKQRLKFEQLDKERIHEMDQAKLRFFTNITHDFKTPLSLIIGPLEKITEKYQQKEDQKYFGIIQNNISRLHRLIDQLISYRKAETGHLKLKYTKTTLGNFIYPLMEAFEENAERAHVNFFYKVYAPNRHVIIDIDNTERILLNLFSNAMKFTQQDGEVSIEAGFNEVEGKEILYIEVSDNGIGIPKEKIDKIFDRFYRGVEDRENWSGTGIGLALCKSLIELMSGNILVESTPGKKTVFKIELPFDINVKVEAKEELSKSRKFVTDWRPSELVELHEISGDEKLPSLLIVDDEEDVRSFLKEAFATKYKISLAVNGEDGLNKLSECNPQLVISDVMMPKVDGYQVCEKIKSNPETCHIPVILLTALEDDSRMIKGLELGADDYIKKPFSIKHLETRVKTLIENKQRLVEYFSKNSAIPEENLNMSSRDRSFLEKIIASIEKNLSDSSFGVEELAKSAGMSTSHLYRRLKQLTGQVPNVYIRNLRLQKAAELLKLHKDITAVEVMYEIGIESPSYFSTSFKKMYGLSPIEFQKNN